MKNLVVVFLSVCICLQVQSQDESLKDVDKRLNKLEEGYKFIKEREDGDFAQKRDIILKGFVNATEIETLLPMTMLLLSYNDLKNQVANINNPATDDLGISFTELVANSASEHLIPEYPNEPRQAKTKFKDFLGRLFRSPLIQGLLNSNPISSIINTAIQQAAVFEKPRAIEVTISREEFRNQRDITRSFSIANSNGPAYDQQMLNEFL